MQSSANNQPGGPVSAPMTWTAINQSLQSSGMPVIRYDQFDQRWNAVDDATGQPTADSQLLKSLVTRYDGHGLEVKTAKHEAEPSQGGKDSNWVEKTAKSAARKEF